MKQTNFPDVQATRNEDFEKRSPSFRWYSQFFQYIAYLLYVAP